MSAKSITSVAAAVLATLSLCAAGAGRASAASSPLLLLFPHDQKDAADCRALIALRTRLRHDGRLEVLSFDPNAPAVILAATDEHHQDWLTDPITTDAERQQIARAVGADYVGVVTHENRGKLRLDMVAMGSAPGAWSLVDYTPVAAALTVEKDVHAPPAAKPGGAGTISAVPQVPSPMAPPAAVTPPAAVPTAPAAPAPSPVAASASDLTAAQPLIAQADQDVADDDVVDAYALYRRAINLDPLSDVPRLKLAQAYLKGGLPDQALSEARRALEVDPHSTAIQEFLAAYDAQTGTAQGVLASAQALADQNPQDPIARLAYAKALWNAGQDAQAVSEYGKARDMAPANSPEQLRAIAHLAALHAALGDYSDSLKDMKLAGDLSYPLVLSVVQNTADHLTTTMDQAQSDYSAGTITRASLYSKVQQMEAQSQSLADFLGQITPPQAYQTSQLDRVQAVNLIAQAAAVFVSYLESNDTAQHDKAVQLEKDAQTDMLTAHAAEEKLGLWNAETQLSERGNG